MLSKYRLFWLSVLLFQVHYYQVITWIPMQFGIKTLWDLVKDLLMLIYTKLYWKWCCYFVLRRVRASNNSFTYEMSHSFSDLQNQGSRSEANEDNNRNNEGCGWWREHHQNWWPWYWCCKWSAHHHYHGGTSELSCWSNCCNFCLKQKNVWAHGRLIEDCLVIQWRTFTT